MKYLSIDVETTGLDPKVDQLLELALVWEDTDSTEPVEARPYLNVIVRHPRLFGQPVALAMNAALIQRIHDSNKWPDVTRDVQTRNPVGRVTGTTIGGVGVLSVEPEDLAPVVVAWIEACASRDRVTVAGKNAAGFDIPFCPPGVRDRFRHRVLDPGSVFVRWTDQVLPDLTTLKRRLDIPGEVAHTALEDARDVIRVLRRAPGYCTLAPEVT